MSGRPGFMPARSGSYNHGLICVNGHWVNDNADGAPERNAKHCRDCGAETIDACPSCNVPIRGRYVGTIISHPDVPSFCHACGAAYPWTVAREQAAHELIEMEERVGEADKAAAKAAIVDVMHDTPRTRVAATRLSLFLAKATPQAATAIRALLVDIASETAKKILFPT